VTNAEAVAAADQRQAKKFRIFFYALQHFGIRDLKVLEPGIDPGFTLGVEQCSQTETVDESLDFSRGHRLLRQIDEVNRPAPFLEEALGGACGL